LLPKDSTKVGDANEEDDEGSTYLMTGIIEEDEDIESENNHESKKLTVVSDQEKPGNRSLSTKSSVLAAPQSNNLNKKLNKKKFINSSINKTKLNSNTKNNVDQDESFDDLMRFVGHTATHINLSKCSKLSSLSLLSLAANCSNVTTLNLSYCTGITDCMMEKIVKGCNQVEVLIVRGCCSISDKAVSHIVNHCINLRALDVADCPRITDKSFTSIISSNILKNKINALNFFNTSISMPGVMKITSNLPKLQYLDVRSCPELLTVLQKNDSSTIGGANEGFTQQHTDNKFKSLNSKTNNYATNSASYSNQGQVILTSIKKQYPKLKLLIEMKVNA
jgi:hypothetical protein